MGIKTPHVNHPDTRSPVNEMTQPEIDQFLTCARDRKNRSDLKRRPLHCSCGIRVFRWKDLLSYLQGRIKMEAIRSNPNVCFEVDESISDGSLAKSVIIWGE